MSTLALSQRSSCQPHQRDSHCHLVRVFRALATHTDAGEEIFEIVPVLVPRSKKDLRTAGQRVQGGIHIAAYTVLVVRRRMLSMSRASHGGVSLAVDL